MFVFYFGVLSAITPPVALAAVAAAPIAGAEPVRTGLSALRLSLVGFIVPFVFVYDPGLLIVVGEFQPAQFVWVLLRVVFAIWLLTSALSGYETGHLAGRSRVARAILGLALLLQGWPWQLVGAAGGCLMIAYDNVLGKRKEGTS